MQSSEDKQWASKYLLDPLNAPEPSQEDGPGNRYRSSISDKSPAINTSTYPTPPTSASPTRSSFSSTNPWASTSSRQQQPLTPTKESSSRRISGEQASGDHKTANVSEPKTGRRRGSSLSERFPGDMSHRPLEAARKDAKAANRAPHLKKRHMPGVDVIDSLDNSIFGSYHHEGPYDATLLARNTSYNSSPLAAVRDSNNEALKATPRENIQDSLTKHVPLQGTAVIPPGAVSWDGRRMDYEEGADLMREEDAPGGAYKRWDFIKYHPDDLKGKGEPSFTIDRALKQHEQKAKSHRRIMSDGDSGYEMQARSRPAATRQRSQSQTHAPGTSSAMASGNSMKYAQFESDMRRSNTTGRKFSEGLKSRFGSLRRSKKTVEA